MTTRRYNVPIQQNVPNRYASDLNDQFRILAEPFLLAGEIARNERSISAKC